MNVRELVTSWGFEVDSSKLDEMDKKILDSKSKLSKFGDKATETGKKLRAMGSSLTLKVSAPIIAMAGLFTKAAASLDHTNRKFAVIFGESAGEVDAWVNSIEGSVDRGTGSIKGVLNKIHPLIKGYGLVGDEAIEMSQGLTRVALSLAEYNEGMDDTQASSILARALAGGVKGLNKYGIAITNVMLEEEMLRQGLTGTITELDDVTASRIRYDVIMRQSADVIKYAAENQDEFAHQQLKIKERLTDIMEVLGGKLLPHVTAFAEKLSELADSISRMDDKKVDQIIKVAGAIALIGPTLYAIGIVASIAGKLVAFIEVLQGLVLVYQAVGASAFFAQAAIAILPIIIIALIALVGYLVYKHWDKISAFFKAGWRRFMATFLAAKAFVLITIVNVWAAVSAFLLGAWDTAINALDSAYEFVKGLFLNFTPLGLIIKHWVVIKKFFVDIWDSVSSTFSTTLDAMIKKFTYFYGKVVSIKDRIKTALMAVFEGVKEKAATALRIMFWPILKMIDFVKGKTAGGAGGATGDGGGGAEPLEGEDSASIMGNLFASLQVPPAMLIASNIGAPVGGGGVGGAVTVHVDSKNEFNVDGSQDPVVVAGIIRDTQEQVNKDLARDLMIKLGMIG